MALGTVQLPEHLGFHELELASTSTRPNDRLMAVLRTQAAAETMLRRLGYDWGAGLKLNGFRAAVRQAAADRGFQVPGGLAEAVRTRNNLSHENAEVTPEQAASAWAVYKGLLADLARQLPGDGQRLVLTEGERNYEFKIEPPPDGLLKEFTGVPNHPQRVIAYWKQVFRNNTIQGVFLPGAGGAVQVPLPGADCFVIGSVNFDGAAAVSVTNDGITFEMNVRDIAGRIEHHAWNWGCATYIVLMPTVQIFGLALLLPTLKGVDSTLRAFGIHIYHFWYILTVIAWILLAAILPVGGLGVFPPRLHRAVTVLKEWPSKRFSTLVPWRDVIRFRHESERLLVETSTCQYHIGLH